MPGTPPRVSGMQTLRGGVPAAPFCRLILLERSASVRRWPDGAARRAFRIDPAPANRSTR